MLFYWNASRFYAYFSSASQLHKNISGLNIQFYFLKNLWKSDKCLLVCDLVLLMCLILNQATLTTLAAALRYLGAKIAFHIQQQPLKWLNWISKTWNVSCMSKALSVNLSLQKNIFRQSNFSIVLLVWFKVQITLHKHMFTSSEFFLSLLRIHQYS